MGRTAGFDWTLPDAPPLRQPPLSLLSLATPLIRVDEAIAGQQDALEMLASAQAAVEAAEKRFHDAPAEAKAAAQLAAEEAQDALSQQRVWASDAALQLAEEQRWEDGFEYLPELTLGQSMEIFVPHSGSTKRTDHTQSGFISYDPFVTVSHDDRSMFGWPASSFAERAQRAQRAALAHEPWEVEHEFWTGDLVPTNDHLTASAATPTSSANRTGVAHADPTAAPGTTLGVAVGKAQAMAALVQAIAKADAGYGMIHATPYLVQLWMSTFPYIRDASGRIYTVNMNLIVPGYGYPGTGPDTADRTVADGVTNSTTTVTSATAAFTASDVGRGITGDGIPAGATIVSRTNATTVIISAPASATATGVSVTVTDTGADSSGDTLQWAYATDTVYSLEGAMRTLPWDLAQGAPEVNVENSVNVRAERSHALITNRLCRAAVLVDTTAP